jgi:hypothetical protein
MRRLTVAFVILFLGAVLAACGDTGDHFGEFRQQPPPPPAAQQLTINMPVIPGPVVQSAKLPIYVTAINAGKAVPIGTNLANPIIITTNYKCCVKFSSPTGPVGKTYGSLSLQAAPPAITVYYKHPPFALCNGNEPPVVVQAYNHDANPQFVTQNLSGCSGSPGPSSSPSSHPSTKPSGSPTPPTSPTPSPTPTPPSNAVKKLTLSMPATPNPLSPGTFTLVVTAFNGSGQAIPTGTVLQNPIQLTSNSSCSISYTSGSSTGTSISVASAPGAVTVAYSPPSTTCTPPSAITLSAFDLDARPQTATFSILGGTSTVGSIMLSMLALPNTTSNGVYPLFVTAKDSSGATIPFGESLTNPIQISSNSCAVGFGVTSNPGTFTSTFQMTSTQTQVFMGFNPATDPTHCTPAGGTVIVTAIAAGGVSTTFSFPY